MANESSTKPVAESGKPAAGAEPSSQALGSATYEIIRQRLQAQGAAVRDAMSRLDTRRREVFGSVEAKLLQADRIVTAHNCVPRDMVQLGNQQFLFGFNVQFGLKKEIELSDVFAIYKRDEESGTFKEAGLSNLQDKAFVTDFKRLYNVYEKTFLSKLSVIDGKLYMVFQVGASVNDFAVFKWAFNDGQLQYLDGRAESEFRKVGFPPQYEFTWRTPPRESFRYGDHPHVSIEDRVFVECIGGDITIKIEDNTHTGEGIYSEPVVDKYQKVDDAEIAYGIFGHLILLKIRPYKEPAARYFIYNEKLQTAVRVDSIGQSCAILPEDHGLIFPDGYYLGTGELKLFESKQQGMTIERVIHAPNGEDSLYVFYNRETGEYVFLAYRLIAQKVEERISCHGFSLFSNGYLVSFRADDEPQKHHMIQLRQTPFYLPGNEPGGRKDAFLYQVGNKDVVRCLAECNEVLTLIRKENPYAELYADLVKRCTTMLDTYSWLSSEDGYKLDDALKAVREVADKAVEEFDKVRRLQREAAERVKEVCSRCEERFNVLRRSSFSTLNDFVTNLASLRHLRGELISLKEVRYVDLEKVAQAEKQVSERLNQLSGECVKFLAKPEALEPYRAQAAAQLAAVEKITKVAEGKDIEKATVSAASELEMMIDIINGLKIEDATETTRIIDGITAVYSTLNQVKAALKKRLHALAISEGAAQFAAQLKLLSQAAASYLDLCDAPAKCEEYLNRLTVQLEEMEGAFADFEEYTVQLADRRTELYQAFEQRKVALVEQRSRKASAMMSAAERILKVIQSRLSGFKTIEDINAYMASDLMVGKVRETMSQLLSLEDSVKADDLQGRLKNVHQEAVRQLKDRQDLFVGGEGVIALGKHRFNINQQPLDLTIVNREGTQFLHLTSTKFFEEVTDEAFLASRDVWDQEVISENAEVYRAEYLAYCLLKSASAPGAVNPPAGAIAGAEQGDTRSRTVNELVSMSEMERLAFVQEFMSGRYQDGYTKGVHDADAAAIFTALLNAHMALQLARYHPTARACAVTYWHRFCPAATRSLWAAKLKGFAERNRLFPGDPVQRNYVAALQSMLSQFLKEFPLFPEEMATLAGEYLFHELVTGEPSFVVSREAHQLWTEFNQHLISKGGSQLFAQSTRALAEHPASEFELIRDWVVGFMLSRPEGIAYVDEVTAMLFCDEGLKQTVVQTTTTRVLEGMRGHHPLIQGTSYRFDYLSFQQRLRRFEQDVVPNYERYRQTKQQLIERARAALRLDQFKPRVLGSFVRNQLIDRIYLPLVGDNLAKQIGAAGEQKRTDLMGLLLIISPPGYGKTTLMEYVANRLGIVFVKINGPALGAQVVSLDPEEAPNAAAREEIKKLNLALEMGDNAMICVDDIQHCNPEFLQKFISLCDGQRKIEGVWRGKPRTYDLRGRKVVVVMAGNPYTESGQKFKIPDMLANRADTYNLGDIIGGNAEWFKSSYLENAVTSNPILAHLSSKSQKDIRTFIRMAETGERDVEAFEASYSARDIEEILSVMKKLVAIREIILRVNQEYIYSAAQADEFRVEPPFKLQGSYRNMNRLAEKVVSVMNDTEVRDLVIDHYRNESQTLTTGAEANLLKFKELIGAANPQEQARWEDIKKTFKRNQVVRGGDSDPVSRVVGLLAAFQSGLESIQKTLEAQLSRAQSPVIAMDLAPLSSCLDSLRATVEERLTAGSSPSRVGGGDALSSQLGEGLKALREDLTRAITAVHTGTMAEKVESLSHELEMIHSTLTTLNDLALQHRDHLKEAQELLALRARQGTIEIDVTQDMLANEREFLQRFQEVVAKSQRNSTPPSAEAMQPNGLDQATSNPSQA